MYQYFSPNFAELNNIISEILKTEKDVLQSAQTVQTGWTNITIDAHGQKGDYIFRFPRNRFFAQAMIKDCMVCQFLQDKISLPIPKMRLLMDKNRPFSMHPKLVGEPLADKMDELPLADQKKVAAELAIFLDELQSIPLHKVPPMMKKSLNQFLIDLAAVHKGNYDFNRHHSWGQIEHSGKLCLTHGDFHAGNVLIDKNNNVSGIIDFAFTTVSNPHADIGRFVGRAGEKWSQILIDAYQSRTQKKCDVAQIQEMVKLFDYVDHKYVDYMRKAHPEIIIPKCLCDPSRE